MESNHNQNVKPYVQVFWKVLQPLEICYLAASWLLKVKSVVEGGGYGRLRWRLHEWANKLFSVDHCLCFPFETVSFNNDWSNFFFPQPKNKAHSFTTVSSECIQQMEVGRCTDLQSLVCNMLRGKKEKEKKDTRSHVYLFLLYTDKDHTESRQQMISLTTTAVIEQVCSEMQHGAPR